MLLALPVGALATAAVSSRSAIAGASEPAGIGASAEAVRRSLRGHVLRTLEGGTLTLGSLAGEVVVVNFWATWCPPCRRELPGLDALQAEIVNKGGRVMAVSIDQDIDNVRRFARAHRLTLPIAHDGPEGLARELNLGHVPFTLVLDRSGAIAFATSGSDARALGEIDAAVHRLIDHSPVAQRDGEAGTR